VENIFCLVLNKPVGVRNIKRRFFNIVVSQLNCVSRIAAMENADKTQLFTKQVIDNLRYRYCRENQIVKITEELEAAKNLLEMFKVRYGDVLTYEIDIDQACVDTYIPHYTILTFVDESIYNSFDKREGVFFIQVSVQRKNEYAEISISDNGKGFDAGSDSYSEYGSVPSTRSRLIQHYGPDHVLKFESLECGVATVKILIPV
jgi:sensor histidine kinase YesM